MFEGMLSTVQSTLQASLSPSPADPPSMANYSSAVTACNSSAIPMPTLFGAEIIEVSANLVQNFSRNISSELYFNHPSIAVRDVEFCNITVAYTHPGHNDTINVETWLPTTTWNGRLQAVGGGGWVAGRSVISDFGMAGAIGDGYVATTSDAGIGSSFTPDSWALLSPGNVNLYALQDFASVALNDQATLAKELIKSFYGRPAAYSYWSGCSQGGRQGLMLAQRYPDAYDGIAAAAPALHWTKLIPASSWAQTQMSLTHQFPHKCELDALTAAAIAHCDPLDGLTDGLISDPSTCTFDPFPLIGHAAPCPALNKSIPITPAAAAIANLTWTGPRAPNGAFLWHGVPHSAQLAGSSAPLGTTSDLGYASTVCAANGTCVGVPTGLGEPWVKYFVQKDANWSYASIASTDEYVSLFRQSAREYASLLDTADADLSAFRDAGGKIMTYHGLADPLIPPAGTLDYYTAVNASTHDTPSFFRFFPVPGLAHCAGGRSTQPTGTFRALVEWVERGVAPGSLAVDVDVDVGVGGLNGGREREREERVVCPYPAVARRGEGRWVCGGV